MPSIAPDNNNWTSVGNNTPRLPSPTPSEQDLLNTRSARILGGFYKPRTRSPWYYYVIPILIVIVVILLAVYQKRIVHGLEPAANKIKNLRGGFLIPVAVFIVISVPPLFGQEIVAVLVGLVWGLGIGFAITAAGTLIGETLVFFAFKYLFRRYGESLEKQRVQYAALAKIIREGGIVIAVVVRYSVVPNHFVTALFSVCGVKLWVFLVSAVLSLPLHVVTVFIGHALKDEQEGKNKTVDNAVTYSTLGATIIVTYAAVFYLGYEMDKIKADLVYQRRKERQMQLSLGDFSVDDGSRMEMGKMKDPLASAEPEGPGYGDRYAPLAVNNDISPLASGSSEQTYPPSSHSLNRNTLTTPNGGGYADTGKRHFPP